MKALLAAVGSRGDVEPMVALAERLIASGHQASLVTHASLLPGVPASIDAVGADSDPAELLAGPAADALRRGNLRALNRTRHLFADFLHAFAEPTLSRLDGTDVLVASTFATPAVHVAMQRRVPVVRAHFWPEYASGDDRRAPEVPLAPYSWLAPPVARRALRWGIDEIGPYLAGVDGAWSGGRLHLAVRHPATLTTATHGSLYAFSPVMSDPRRPDAHATGWWLRCGAAELSTGTRRLLEQPGTWVGVSFGSMPPRALERLIALVGEAVARVGVRAVVQFPGATGELAPGVVGVGYEPHQALFPRLAAVVHHGGAGTSGTALRTGVPSVVVPHVADQFFWGRRMAQLGVAARPVPARLLTARGLASRLRAALTDDMADRAALLAARIQREDGTGEAVRVLERHLAPS